MRLEVDKSYYARDADADLSDDTRWLFRIVYLYKLGKRKYFLGIKIDQDSMLPLMECGQQEWFDAAGNSVRNHGDTGSTDRTMAVFQDEADSILRFRIVSEF